MKHFAVIFFFAILLLNGCVAGKQNAVQPPVVENEDKIELPNFIDDSDYISGGNNGAAEETGPEVAKYSACNNERFPAYFESMDLERRAKGIENFDFNSTGFCSSDWCFSFMETKVSISKDKIIVHSTEYFDARSDVGFSEVLLYLPENAKNISIFADSEKIGSYSVESKALSFKSWFFGDENDFFSAVKFNADLLKGRKKIEYSYSYVPKKNCSDNVCFYLLFTAAQPGQIVRLEIDSQKPVVGNYRKLFRGQLMQIVALSESSLFESGNLEFSESQRKYFTANKEKIERVTKHLDFIENISGQKLPEKIFVFFSNNFYAETSFTYDNPVIFLRGDSFDEYFEETLVHELSHQAQSNPNYPDWLKEGLARFTERKYYNKIIDGNLTNNKYVIAGSGQYYLSDRTDETYSYSSSIVQDLIEKRGCEKFKEFLFELYSLDSEFKNEQKRVNAALAKVYGDISYAGLVNRKF